MSRFDDVAAELQALGLTISLRPGEYCIQRRGDRTAAGYLVDDLDEALAYGRAAAAEPQPEEPVPAARRRTKPPRPLNARAALRRFIRRHNCRRRGRAGEQRETS